MLKSYTCTKCGGVLNFDENQEIFECPFCGQEFNYTDFHRDELLNQASKCLKEFRYDTAKEKYDTLLSNNPQDFEAMRGMVLVQGRISSIDQLDLPENIRDCDFAAAIKASDEIGKTVDGSSESGYFVRLTNLLKLGEEFRDKTADALDKSEKVREKYSAAVEGEKKSKEALDITGKDIGLGLAVGFGVLFQTILFAIGFNITWLVPASLFMFGVIALIVLAVFLIHRHKVRYTIYNVPKPSEHVTAGHIIQDFLSEEAVEIKKRYTEELDLLKKADPASNGYKPPKVKNKSSANNPFIDITKTVNCAKCGGQLYLDKDKGMFECKFCGVAYGTSLFFDNTLKKAKEAVNRGDFIEADQRFSHMLMVNPNDFDALLGRIFCAGKWKMIYDIELSDKMLPTVCKNLKDRCSEGVDHAADEDRAFFLTMRDIADVLEKHMHNEQALKKCQNELRTLEENADIRFSGSVISEEQKIRKSEINLQIQDCSTVKFKLLDSFRSLKESLLNEKDNHAARVSAS